MAKKARARKGQIPAGKAQVDIPGVVTGVQKLVALIKAIGADGKLDATEVFALVGAAWEIVSAWLRNPVSPPAAQVKAAVRGL